MKDKIRIILRMTATLLFVFSISCISGKPAVDAPKDIIHFPIGIAVHPDGRYAAVVNANFNQAYKNGSVVFVDLQTFRIIPEWTIPIGSFGGEIVFNHAGTRMYVAVRGGMLSQWGLSDEPPDVVIAYDVNRAIANQDPTEASILDTSSRQTIEVAPDPFGLAVDYSDRYVYVTHISSGEVTILQEPAGLPIDGEEMRAVEAGELLRRCVPEHNLCPSTAQDGMLCGACESDANCATAPAVVPTEIGGLPMELDNSCLASTRYGNNFCATYCEADKTSFNEAGEIVRIGCPEGYRCEKILPFQPIAERKLPSGGNQAAISPLSGSVYVTHRDSNVIGVLKPLHVEGIGYRARVRQFVIGDGYDMRGLAFSPDGRKLFISARMTNSDGIDKPGVVFMDTSLKYDGCSPDEYISETTSCEKNEVVDFVDVGYEPANLVLVDSYLYVTIFSEDEIYAVDTRTRRVVDVISVAPENFIREPGIFREHANPYDIAYYQNELGSFGLVSNFQAHEVAVIHFVDNNGIPIHRVERKIENRAKLYEEDQY